MRFSTGLILFTAIHCAFALTAKKEKDYNDKGLTVQCSQFVRSCVDVCEKQNIQSLSTGCNSEEVSCMCNEKEMSEKILSSMYSEIKEVEPEVNKEGSEESEVNKEEEAMMAESNEKQSKDAEFVYQNMEYIYPNQKVVKQAAFQKNFCSKYLIKCKQDCPAAFSSYFCDANKEQTGFLLSCMCNGVDIASSVNIQTQAEFNNYEL